MRNYVKGVIRHDNSKHCKWFVNTNKKHAICAAYLIALISNKQGYNGKISEAGKLDSKAKILYGCKSRGGSLHVELLG
jgi:hypothetical protein